MEKTLSETKEDLIKKTETYKHSIEGQINQLKGDATKIGKIALVAGATIFIAYLLIKGKKKDKINKIINVDGKKYALAPVKSSEPFLVKSIRKYLIIFLASLAKQKLALYLEKLKHNTANVEANSRKTPELQERW